MLRTSVRTLKQFVTSQVQVAPELAHTEFESEHAELKSCLTEKDTLRLLSFNIQVGINTQHYRHYVTRGWQHVLPHHGRDENLNRISHLLRDYDLVAIQEADGGSIRSGHINQIEYLARRAGFPFWYQQLNRNLGKFAQHSNGLLSRVDPDILEDHKLPGRFPGRGAIVAKLGHGNAALLVVMMHLSLSSRSRNRQLSYIRELVGDHPKVILMGDMNTHAEQLLDHSPLSNTNLVSVQNNLNTFPSWQPNRALDHILVSNNLLVKNISVVDMPMSDHLPVALELKLL
ncbi:endonuclease/exonuclease/phosphatase family protein [Spartinivicinus poritis]|uniref:Endonuclease/exonuclease/phosphatase family protein n=1 Tax=Spartinivicinus poritis TaxID=2994640 RepID=A0ABT5UC76_9GAMM|nr:endonuclease/exonuclease/phosphatase family protein [Spartinivicinus sp. A2-2]MDE1463591.1 endonuclease/exonuclease/phosphatase family protein [Spartinivicinus sp. A2-2]